MLGRRKKTGHEFPQESRAQYIYSKSSATIQNDYPPIALSAPDCIYDEMSSDRRFAHEPHQRTSFRRLRREQERNGDKGGHLFPWVALEGPVVRHRNTIEVVLLQAALPDLRPSLLSSARQWLPKTCGEIL